MEVTTSTYVIRVWGWWAYNMREPTLEKVVAYLGVISNVGE